jgi:hypothetical protein
MPEGIPYASSNVIAGTGLDLNYVGKKAYAYSGAVGVASTTKLLSFKTGNKIISGRMYTGYCSPTHITDDMSFEVKLNGVLISARYADTSKEANTINMIYYTMIIPPYSLVEVFSTNISSGTERDMCAIFTGKIV